MEDHESDPSSGDSEITSATGHSSASTRREKLLNWNPGSGLSAAGGKQSERAVAPSPEETGSPQLSGSLSIFTKN